MLKREIAIVLTTNNDSILTKTVVEDLISLCAWKKNFAFDNLFITIKILIYQKVKNNYHYSNTLIKASKYAFWLAAKPQLITSLTSLATRKYS